MLEYSREELGASVVMSERIVQKEDGFWYFRIRGNATMGPYSNYREAERSLDRYVASCQRQAELSIGWPRWLHPRFLLRRFRPQETPAATPATERR
jgi:Domain of unknown function (DUF6316)